jgi:hypothetical protein
MILIYCSFRLVGFHHFPKAPKEVSYLRKEHRHEFHFKVSVEVTHDNREIEFHTLKRDCLNILEVLYTTNDYSELTFGAQSCEMIAAKLLAILVENKKYDSYPTIDERISIHPVMQRRQIIVEVSEDGENCGIVTRI